MAGLVLTWHFTSPAAWPENVSIPPPGRSYLFDGRVVQYDGTDTRNVRYTFTARNRFHTGRCGGRIFSWSAGEWPPANRLGGTLPACLGYRNCSLSAASTRQAASLSRHSVTFCRGYSTQRKTTSVSRSQHRDTVLSSSRTLRKGERVAVRHIARPQIQ